MALLLRPLEISSITSGSGGAPVRLIQRIKSRKNTRISPSCIKDLDFRCSDGVYRLVTERKTAPPFVEEKKKLDYYANTGYAIRTLREEMPDLFYRELSFDIYRDDIVFKDPINAFTGIDNYKSILWSLRFHGRIFFRALWIDIVRIWQPAEKENTIMVRWTVHGIPRTPWEGRSRFDGTSEYKLDRDGKIYELKVDNIAPNGPQIFQFLAVEQLLHSIICPPTQITTCYYNISSSLSRGKLLYNDTYTTV